MDLKDLKFVTILGIKNDAIPIQVSTKSVCDIKTKFFSLEQFEMASFDFDSLSNVKSPKDEFAYQNMIPLPHLLTNVFLSQTEMDPVSIAVAFL
jgi:hypothetical protein